VGFAARVVGAALVVTGEGRIDHQSGYGKLTGAVTAAARRAGVPVVAVAGSLGAGHQTLGLDAIAIASEGVRIVDAMREPLPLIERAAERLVRAQAPRTD
jgi:glycerate kinase